MCKRLLGKNAFVTGAARGMGFAIAKALYQEGARVALLDIDEKGVREVARQLDGKENRAFGRKIDVTHKGEINGLVKEVKKLWGSVDILVNNAGGALNTPHVLEEIDEKDWNLVVDVNLKGVFLCSQVAIPEMVKQGGGVIVNISALAGHWRASLAGVQYTAAKAGVEGLTRQLAYDWGAQGGRVNAVAPTVTLTGDRMRKLWSDKKKEDQARMIQQIPLRRLSKPEEIAAAVVSLASDDASYITGITLDVNGGRYLR